MKFLTAFIIATSLFIQACTTAPSLITTSREEVIGADMDAIREMVLQAAAERYQYEENASRLRAEEYQSTPTQNPLICNNVNSGSRARNNIVSLDFFEMDLREALLELSIMADFPIIADDTIAGFISLSLSNVALNRALEMVLATGDFSYKFYDDYALVGASTPDAPSFAKLASTCRYKPLHVAPVDLASTLSPYYQQFIRVSQQADYLTITAPGGTMEQIEQDLIMFDARPGQVLLEMTIVEVSREALDIIGVAWDQATRNPTIGDSRNFGLAEWAGITAEQALDKSGVFYGLMPQRTLAESVQALQSQGEATVKAMPSIVSIDGNEALFSSTQTVWLPYSTTVNSGSSADRRNQLTYGVEMRVVPRISVDGSVRLNILNASVSDLATGQDDQPRLISHSISNTVSIQDGDYLILGGLLQKKLRNSNTGLPLSSPFKAFDFLSSTTETEEEEMEVLIMIRPTILQG